MGKIVVTEFMSLDGVIEAPGGGEEYEHGGWSFKFDRGEDGDKFKLDELMAADVQLLGRVTYQGFAKAWPSMGDMNGFGKKMNEMPKYVVSRTVAASPARRHRSSSSAVSQKCFTTRYSRPSDMRTANGMKGIFSKCFLMLMTIRKHCYRS